MVVSVPNLSLMTMLSRLKSGMRACAFYYAAQSHPGLVIVRAQDGSKPAVCKSS